MRRAEQIDTSSEFSAELDGHPEESAFGMVYEGNPPSRELLRMRHFSVFADLAPLTVGHLLVVPRTYVPSFAQLASDAWQEWEKLRNDLADAVGAAWGPALFYEHGSTGAMRGSACITHAHLQVVPMALDLASEMRRDGLEVLAVRNQRDVRGAAERPYFYVELAGGDAHLAWADAPAMPSQYLRRLVARLLGLPDPAWDWGVVVNRQLLRETLKTFPMRGSA